MAHGTKRIWAGSVLLGFAVVAGAVVIGSRWYSMSGSHYGNEFLDSIELSGGFVCWRRHRMEDFPSMPRITGWRNYSGKQRRPFGPVGLLKGSNLSQFQVGGTMWGGTAWIGMWDQGRTQVIFIAWPLPLILLGAGVVPFWMGLRARNRSRRGLCGRCGYDLRSGPVAPAPCPECGAARGEARRAVH